MRRFLGLLLALVAPAQAAIHHDGFEASMPVSNWMPSLLEGAKDGALSKTVSSINPRAYATFGTALAVPAMSLGDFPTTPTRITGFEIRISALASHPGVSIKELHFQSYWQNTPSALEVFAGANASTPSFDVGTPGELADAGYLAVGGYMALMMEEATRIGPTSPVAMLDGGYVYYDHSDIRSPFLWLNDVMDAPVEIAGYTKNRDDIYVLFESADGYNAEIYIDSIEFRLHYEDASTAAMSGSGTMAVTLQKMKPISAGMSGSGSVAATMNAERVISAAMSGSGRIDPVLTRDSGGTIYRYLMPELSGGGTMSVTPLIRYAPIPAAMSGGGTMSATLRRGHGIKASAPAAMNTSGTLVHSLRAQRPIARALTGSGAINASGVTAHRPIPAAMSGSGTMTAAMIAQRIIESDMAASGTIGIALQAGRPQPAISLSGSGTVSAAAIARRPIAAAMNATGLISGIDAGLIINTRLSAPEGRTFSAGNWDALFIAQDDFQTFEVGE